jgi:DNA-binding MarR family transcriptional regulator
MIESDASDVARVLDCLPALRRALGTDVPTSPSGDSISSTQFYAVRALEHRDRTAGELARAISVRLPTLTQIVDALVDRGWIERRDDPADRRKVWLSLTESGREAAHFAGASAEARLETVLSEMTQPQRRALVKGMEALRGAIQAQRRQTGKRPEVARADGRGR